MEGSRDLRAQEALIRNENPGFYSDLRKLQKLARRRPLEDPGALVLLGSVLKI